MDYIKKFSKMLAEIFVASLVVAIGFKVIDVAATYLAFLWLL